MENNYYDSSNAVSDLLQTSFLPPTHTHTLLHHIYHSHNQNFIAHDNAIKNTEMYGQLKNMMKLFVLLDVSSEHVVWSNIFVRDGS